MLHLGLTVLPLLQATATDALTEPLGNAAALFETVATFETRPGNPTVLPDGRVIVSMHPMDLPGPFEGPAFMAPPPMPRVVEVLEDGTTVPFPNAAWSSPPGDDNRGLSAVIGVAAAPDGVLWMLDMGSETHSPKLVGWDTGADALRAVHYLPREANRPNSFHQDLAIDAERNCAYIADMTMPGPDAEPSPALVVVHLDTGFVRRPLEHVRWFAAEEHDTLVAGAVLAPPGPDGAPAPLRLPLNPIAFDADSGQVVFGSVTGHTLWQISADALSNADLVEAEVSVFIKRFGPKSDSDGICVGPGGAVFVTDIERSAIGISTPGGYSLLAEDSAALSWPDGVAMGPDGALYATVNSLHLHPNFAGEEGPEPPPFTLVRFAPEAVAAGCAAHEAAVEAARLAAEEAEAAR